MVSVLRILALLIPFQLLITGPVQAQANTDTAYVRKADVLDSSTFSFKLVFTSNSKTEVIYTLKVRGGADMKMVFLFDHKEDSTYLKCFAIYDGLYNKTNLIFWNRKDNHFYLAERAGAGPNGEITAFRWVDFNKKEVRCEYISKDQKSSEEYTVTMVQLWPRGRRR